MDGDSFRSVRVSLDSHLFRLSLELKEIPKKVVYIDRTSKVVEEEGRFHKLKRLRTGAEKVAERE